MVEEKRCCRCELVKPTTEFYWKSKKSRILRHICKPCHNTKTKKWYTENRDEHKKMRDTLRADPQYKTHEREKNRKRTYESRLANEYGISLEDYFQMFYDQLGCCKICGRQDPGLYVDHCHTTRRVRGLLCRECNWGLGQFKDNPFSLLAAVRYLRESLK